MKHSSIEFVTAAEAKELLGVTTREGVVYMIKQEQLPGSRKISQKRNSAWLIPMAAIKAHPNYIAKTKRGQSVKTD